MRPRQVQGVEREELSEEDVVFVHTASEKALVLNAMGGVVWDLCDGERTTDDIARFICRELTDAKPEQVRADVERLVRELVAGGLLEDAGG